MKSYIFTLIVLAIFISSELKSEKVLRPYIYGAKSKSSIKTIANELETKLKSQSFTILGKYRPADDANRYVIVIGSSYLDKAVRKTKGLTAFASSLRIAITNEGGLRKITYTNPYYWGNAYFRDDYPKVESEYKIVFSRLISVMKKTGEYVGVYFGSEDGIEIDDLREYQYMMGMPEFDDVVELKEFDSYEKAVSTIDKNLKTSKNLSLVYKKEIAGSDLCVYGIALSGSEGESHFLPVIDISEPKHTAFLPYEILVKGDEVVMLHGRYRIALSFPDLTMSTFTKIMSTPGDIEEMMETLVEN